ncbi:MAG: hypothetical protein KDD36_03765 [Flavobacteriales bacterium]|nr:hypothetical protein [Flavobacteriales bacterium]
MGAFEIAIYLLIGLGTVLAFVTYRLLAEDKKRNRKDVRRINAIYVFIIFFMVICQVIILDRFSVNERVTITNADGRSLSIQVNHTTLPWDEFSRNDTSRYYASKEDGFTFKLPEGIRPELKRLTGFDAYLESVNLETTRENIDAFISFSQIKRVLNCISSNTQPLSYEESLQCFRESSGISKYGKMLRKSVSTRWICGNSVQLTFNNHSSSNITGLLFHEDSLKTQDSTANLSHLQFTPYFSVTVFERPTGAKNDPAFSLANYFISSAANMIYDVEKIVADERNILVASKLRLDNVSYGGIVDHFDIHRWVQLLQSDDHVYLVEIAYSPQSDPRDVVWEDLKDAFESFRCYQ